MKVLITGVSGGLGRGPAAAHLARGDEVYGVSRREPPAELAAAGLRHRPLDLAEHAAVGPALAELLGDARPELVYLNAGVLGELRDLGEADLAELKATFEVNLWSQKTALDALHERGVEPDQVVAISSGASVSGHRGWSGYGMSKAALNMLVKLYAAERPGTHFTSLAPGIIDTGMQATIAGLEPDPRHPTLDRLRAARGTPAMPTPGEAAERILALLPRLRALPSGAYADVRKLAPAASSPGRRPALERLDELLPPGVRGVEARATPIPSIAARAKQLAAEHPGMVRADIGQITGVDPEKEVLYGPPVGLPELRAALAETYNLAHGLEPGAGGLGPEHVCVTTGAAEGLSALFRCFAPGRRVGLPRGHWSNYLNGVELAGGEPVVLDFFDEAGALDLEGLRAGVLREGLEVLVANFPCNPTGAVLDREEAAALGALAEELGVLIIADEVYDRLRYDGHPPLSLLPFAPGNVVVVSSASKEYLLPGARVGWVLAAEPRLTDKVLRKVVRASTASPNVLGQRRLLELLEPDLADLRAGRDPAILTGVREAMRARRDRLLAILEEHGMPPVGRPGHTPEGTIFLMAGLPGWWPGDDAAFVDAALEAAAVSTVPGSAFGLPGAVRFSYGGMTLEALEALGANLARLREAHAAGA